jgi:hypothetical protein
MPNNNPDLPIIQAVADRHAPSSGLTEVQRASALQSIAAFRAIAAQFLDSAEQVIRDGNLESLRTTINNGFCISTALMGISEALWVVENAEIAAMGKEG